MTGDLSIRVETAGNWS